MNIHFLVSRTDLGTLERQGLSGYLSKKGYSPSFNMSIDFNTFLALYARRAVWNANELEELNKTFSVAPKTRSACVLSPNDRDLNAKVLQFKHADSLVVKDFPTLLRLSKVACRVSNFLELELDGVVGSETQAEVVACFFSALCPVFSQPVRCVRFRVSNSNEIAFACAVLKLQPETLRAVEWCPARGAAFTSELWNEVVCTAKDLAFPPHLKCFVVNSATPALANLEPLVAAIKKRTHCTFDVDGDRSNKLTLSEVEQNSRLPFRECLPSVNAIQENGNAFGLLCQHGYVACNYEQLHRFSALIAKHDGPAEGPIAVTAPAVSVETLAVQLVALFLDGCERLFSPPDERGAPDAPFCLTSNDKHFGTCVRMAAENDVGKTIRLLEDILGIAAFLDMPRLRQVCHHLILRFTVPQFLWFDQSLCSKAMRVVNEGLTVEYSHGSGVAMARTTEALPLNAITSYSFVFLSGENTPHISFGCVAGNQFDLEKDPHACLAKGARCVAYYNHQKAFVGAPVSIFKAASNVVFEIGDKMTWRINSTTGDVNMKIDKKATGETHEFALKIQNFSEWDGIYPFVIVNVAAVTVSISMNFIMPLSPPCV